MKSPADVEALRAALRGQGLDGLEAVFAYGAGEELSKPRLGGRRRTRLTIADEAGIERICYLKRYGPQRVAEAIRRWLRHGRRGSPAAIERDNILAAQAAGVPTMDAIDWGAEPCPLGALRSYLVVSAVPGEALERCLEGFLARHADDGQVEELTRELARLVRRLHRAGYVHRDLYSSHVFLDESGGGAELHLIDLARMFAPRWRRFRWCARDLAQLQYSMPPAWVTGWWRRFLAEYLAGAEDAAFRRWDRAVGRKAASIRRRAGRRRRREGPEESRP